MSTLTPTTPRPVIIPTPRPMLAPVRMPVGPSVSAMRPCDGCSFVFCRCPRKGWGITTTAAGPSVQPGKGTRPPTGGGVHPPQPGWGGKSR